MIAVRTASRPQALLRLMEAPTVGRANLFRVIVRVLLVKCVMQEQIR